MTLQIEEQALIDSLKCKNINILLLKNNAHRLRSTIVETVNYRDLILPRHVIDFITYTFADDEYNTFQVFYRCRDAEKGYSFNNFLQHHSRDE